MGTRAGVHSARNLSLGQPGPYAQCIPCESRQIPCSALNISLLRLRLNSQCSTQKRRHHALSAECPRLGAAETRSNTLQTSLIQGIERGERFAQDYAHRQQSSKHGAWRPVLLCVHRRAHLSSGRTRTFSRFRQSDLVVHPRRIRRGRFTGLPRHPDRACAVNTMETCRPDGALGAGGLLLWAMGWGPPSSWARCLPTQDCEVRAAGRVVDGSRTAVAWSRPTQRPAHHSRDFGQASAATCARTRCPCRPEDA